MPAPLPENPISRCLAGSVTLLAWDYATAFAEGGTVTLDMPEPADFRDLITRFAASCPQPAPVGDTTIPLAEASCRVLALAPVIMGLTLRWEGRLRDWAAAWELALFDLGRADARPS